MPAVSVILPTHNRAYCLRRSIESVLNQSFADFELIVVDDCSSDGTPDILREIDDKRVRCLHSAKQIGAGGARNYGIRAATTALLAFQDSDDQWYPDKLQRQLECLNQSSDIGVVYSDMLRINSDGSEALLDAPDVVNDSIVDPTGDKYCVQQIGIQSCLIKRSCVEQVGGFDESMPSLEDLELFIRLSRICKFKRIETPLVRYYESEGLSSNLVVHAKSRQMLLQIYKDQIMAESENFMALERERIQHFLNLASLESQQANSSSGSVIVPELSAPSVAVYRLVHQVISKLRNVFVNRS